MKLNDDFPIEVFDRWVTEGGRGGIQFSGTRDNPIAYNNLWATRTSERRSAKWRIIGGIVNESCQHLIDNFLWIYDIII